MESVSLAQRGDAHGPCFHVMHMPSRQKKRKENNRDPATTKIHESFKLNTSRPRILCSLYEPALSWDTWAMLLGALTVGLALAKRSSAREVRLGLTLGA